MSSNRSSELLHEYAAKNAVDAARAEELLTIRDPEVLFSLLATRVTDPAAMYATPGDRYGTKFNAGEITRSVPMIDLGKKIFLRCSAALHDFLCKPTNDDKQLQQSLINALVSKEVGAVGVIAGGLVALFGMAPAVAAVVAAILVQVVVVPTVGVLCQEWDATIDRALRGKKNS
jgi:hypothetical protein